MRRNLVIIFLIATFSVFSAYAQTDVKNLKKGRAKREKLSA